MEIDKQRLYEVYDFLENYYVKPTILDISQEFQEKNLPCASLYALDLTGMYNNGHLSLKSLETFIQHASSIGLSEENLSKLEALKVFTVEKKNNQDSTEDRLKQAFLEKQDILEPLLNQAESIDKSEYFDLLDYNDDKLDELLSKATSSIGQSQLEKELLKFAKLSHPKNFENETTDILTDLVRICEKEKARMLINPEQDLSENEIKRLKVFNQLPTLTEKIISDTRDGSFNIDDWKQLNNLVYAGNLRGLLRDREELSYLALYNNAEKFDQELQIQKMLFQNFNTDQNRDQTKDEPTVEKFLMRDDEKVQQQKTLMTSASLSDGQRLSQIRDMNSITNYLTYLQSQYTDVKEVDKIHSKTTNDNSVEQQKQTSSSKNWMTEEFNRVFLKNSQTSRSTERSV